MSSSLRTNFAYGEHFVSAMLKHEVLVPSFFVWRIVEMSYDFRSFREYSGIFRDLLSLKY